MPQIIPIKDLKNTSEISDMCHKAEEPIYVTKNGYGDMVIMSMESYESMMKQITMYRDIEISEKQIEAGQVKDAYHLVDRLKNKQAAYLPVKGLEQLITTICRVKKHLNAPKGGSSHYTFRKSGCQPITIPKYEPIKKVYVEMVKQIVESEAMNDENDG